MEENNLIIKTISEDESIIKREYSLTQKKGKKTNKIKL